MHLGLDDLRSIRASLCHTFDNRFGMPPAHLLARALNNLEAEIDRLERIEKASKELAAQDDGCQVLSIELARAKKTFD